MRPAHKTISAGVWIVREQVVSHFEAALLLRASEPGPSLATVSPKPFRFASFFSTPKGKGISMSTKLYVGNLSFQTTSQDLQELFGQAGTVQSANVIEDRDTGRSKGFAFIEMSTQEEANSAIEQFNGKEVGGRALKVNEAKPRENRSGGGGGGRGFGGNRGGGGFGGNRNGGGGGRQSEPRW